ncbi:calcium:proton antiporter [Bdellovibrio sp. KM01]|uniref:calcium:proton antiporter n=1 Tax=Bdellovibrio sp. KM01 TaxID=2748865 RepID=UPI0015E9A506|nr:calcium:proton antiporter [Bdellovibrio sp. KM01]QLY24037.1 calcium:proton antiporter [Bdellovibrio sp. KM01]
MFNLSALRLLTSWGSVLLYFLVLSSWMDSVTSPAMLMVLFTLFFAVIMWSAFGVVHEAEELAEIMGEPYGTLILTLSIVVIEVALVAAVMLGSNAAPTMGRDTMFSVLMIVMNGVVGLGLFIGGLKHREQSYNLQGAASYLSVLIPLTCIALILPNFTTSTESGTFSFWQSTYFSIFSIALYGVFLITQTGRHRAFYVHQIEGKVDEDVDAPRPPIDMAKLRTHVILLLANILPIVLLSKGLAKILDAEIKALNLPLALGGVVVAAIVFAPEGISALRAVARNDLQRTVNLCLGAATSTVGLTVPVILAIASFTGQKVVLGLAPREVTLLGMTLILSTLTFSNRRTTMLEGTVHLVLFFVFLVLVFNP